MTVVAVDRSESGLEGLSGDMVRQRADASDPTAAAPMVERIDHQMGPPHVLVNTIGGFQTGDALTTTPDLLRQMLDVNLGPALWLSQAVAPHMQRKRLRGHRPHHGSARYRAHSGHGGLCGQQGRPRPLDAPPRSRTAAVGIRVNSVAPQLLDTTKKRSLFPADVLAHAVAPEAIAEVVAFLVSEAAAPISGAILPAYGA